MNAFRRSLMVLVALPALCLAQRHPPELQDPSKAIFAEESSKRDQCGAAVSLLGSVDAKERDRGSAWLVAFLNALRIEERVRDAMSRRQSDGYESIREAISRDLADLNALSDAALPVVRLYFEAASPEQYDWATHDAAKALCKLAGEDAARLRCSLASKPHPNLVVVAEVLRKMVVARESLPEAQLLLLCGHHRPSIRNTARALLKQQGGKEPPAFDPVAALQRPAIAKLLARFEALKIDMPPADSPWIDSRQIWLDKDKKESWRFENSGWLVKLHGDSAIIATPFGWLETVGKAAEPLLRNRTYDTQVVCTFEKSRIEKEVAQVEQSRKRNKNPGMINPDECSLAGPLSGHCAGGYELLLAQRLHAAGKNELAARILFPALDTLYRDEIAVDLLRDWMNNAYGYRMLVAFVGDRDYARAESIARRIIRNHPESRFRKDAILLAAELPKRRDDFVTLKLPTPDEWEKMSSKMTRTERIEFLCGRFRLLNYFWAMYDTSIHSISTQYAEPVGMESDAVRQRWRGTTEVINPVFELTPKRWLLNPKGDEFELGVKDIPILTKHMRDDWSILALANGADRSFGTTRELFAEAINHVATKDLCHIDEWAGLAPAGIDREIARIDRWAEANASKSKIDLHWNAVDEAMASKDVTFRDVESRLYWLLHQKETRVFDVLTTFLEKKDLDPGAADRIFGVLLRHNSARAKDVVPKYFDHTDPNVRFDAAVLAFRTGAKDRARSLLGDGLEHLKVNHVMKMAVDSLLEDGSVASREQVSRLFKNATLNEVPEFRDLRGIMLRSCAKAGMRQPYAYYRKQLDNAGVAYCLVVEEKERDVTYAEFHAAEIVETFAPDDSAVKKFAAQQKSDAGRIPQLKIWLEKKLAGP